MHGDSSHYMRNPKANNNVRVRIGGRWRTGRAHPLPDINRTANSQLGGQLLTVRIDLDRR